MQFDVMSNDILESFNGQKSWLRYAVYQRIWELKSHRIHLCLISWPFWELQESFFLRCRKKWLI